MQAFIQIVQHQPAKLIYLHPIWQVVVNVGNGNVFLLQEEPHANDHSNRISASNMYFSSLISITIQYHLPEWQWMVMKLYEEKKYMFGR